MIQIGRKKVEPTSSPAANTSGAKLNLLKQFSTKASHKNPHGYHLGPLDKQAQVEGNILSRIYDINDDESQTSFRIALRIVGDQQELGIYTDSKKGVHWLAYEQDDFPPSIKQDFNRIFQGLHDFKRIQERSVGETLSNKPK